MSLLAVKGLTVRYGKVVALRDVGLELQAGKITAILGSNGAGKSTLLKAILGVVGQSQGSILFDGDVISNEPIDRRVNRGIVLVPEGRRILISLTVEENLLLTVRPRTNRADLRRDLDSIYARFSNLAERRNMLASCLSGGEQQMLAIGRALIAKPRLIMLDEPSLGLSPLFVEHLFELIADLNRQGMTILLVEQNTAKALSIAHRALVLELGQVVVEGDPAVLAKDRRLQEAYLGRDHNSAAGASQPVGPI